LSRLWTIVCFAAISSLPGCHSKPSLASQQQAGKYLYQVRCAHRHKYNNLYFKKMPPTLHVIYAQTTLPSGTPVNGAAVQRVVLAGTGRMPSIAGRFTDEQMAALLAYLQTGRR
jgi:mono/diheme cytochrome c family protein